MEGTPGEMPALPTRSSVTGSITLLALPAEIVSIVLSHCDKSTALALVRVSPRFSSVNIDAQLWSHLQLSVPDHPYTTTRDGSQWSVDEAKSAEVAIGHRLAAKVKGIVDRADDRRAAMVRSIELVPRTSAMGDMLELLSRTASSLEVLSISAPAHHPLQSHWRPSAIFTLDARLPTLGITLPALHTLTLGRYATHFAGFTPYLCSRAPILRTLSIDVRPQPTGLANSNGPQYGPPEPHPSIADLHISQTDDGLDVLRDSKLVTTHFHYLPNLRRISGDYRLEIEDGSTDWENDSTVSDDDSIHWGPGGAMGTEQQRRVQTMRRLVQAIGGLEHVEHLEWRAVRPWDFYRSMEPEGFRALRRVVLGEVSWVLLLDSLLDIPNLESIFFSGLHDDPSPGSPPIYPTAISASQMTPNFAYFLHGSPHLHIMHILDSTSLAPDLGIFSQLDQIESSGSANGYINSYRHGQEEVLYARLLVGLPDSFVVYTHYKGRVVPLEVLEEMRAVEGKSEAEWRRRGVEAGEAAWEVLMAGEGTGGRVKGMDMPSDRASGNGRA